MRRKILIIFIILAGLCAGGFFVYRNIFVSKGWFQRGNTLPITQLQLKRSPELEDNRMGDMYTLCREIFIESPDTSEDPDDFANRMGDMGLKWMRVSIDTFDWNEVEEMGAYSKHRIYPEQDRAIAALAENGIKVMHTLVFWDKAIQVGKDYYRFKTEDEIERFLDYVRFIVRHFKGKIEYYEILNEPNAGLGPHRGKVGTQQDVEVADYIKLVKRTVPVIRQEDPKAKIVAGAVTPLYCIEDTVRADPLAREYLFSILESEVMPLVDAVSWHAMGGASPAYGEEYYYEYPSIVENIKSTASAHGFEGEYIAEELHWRTSNSPHPSEYDEYSELAAVKYLARGIVMSLGMDLTTGPGAGEDRQMSVVQNLANVMAGARPTSLPIEIQSKATNIRSYSFSSTNGDKLIALWTDGVAVDEDPGVKANVTFNGLAAQSVTATDVLNGYQQSITTSNKNGNLIIQNLIVRDYPLILHIK